MTLKDWMLKDCEGFSIVNIVNRLAVTSLHLSPHP